MTFHFEILGTWGPFILEGLWVVLGLSLVSAFIGVAIGLVCAFLKKKKIIGTFLSFYIDFFRGTPVFVQLYFVYFGLPALMGLAVDKWWVSIIVFGLNSGAYLAEIMRAGLKGSIRDRSKRRKRWALCRRILSKISSYRRRYVPSSRRSSMSLSL